MRISNVIRAAIVAVALMIAAGPEARAVTVFAENNGIALGGYDVVSYFVSGAPAEGSKTHKARHNGITYRFANADNRALFEADPEKYAPAYGGHCALGVRYGQKSPVDPEAWRIHDGRLFLLLNRGTAAVWDRKKAINISKADKVWPVIQ